MIDFFTSKKGKLTARCDGIMVHSTIDPEKEAEKYLLSKKELAEKTVSLVILLFPGLNYLHNSVKKIFPKSKIITIHLSAEFFKHSVAEYGNEPVWHPECCTDIITFLNNHTYEIDAQSFIIISWEPALKAFPQQAKKISSAVERIFTQYNLNITTTSGFGKKQIKNAFRNIMQLENIICFSKSTNNKLCKPILITGSGPTLEKCVDFMIKNRRLFFLIALSSSIEFLKEKGIIPDIVITTDPGFYASLHLKPFSRCNVTLAFPLTANIGSKNKQPAFIFNQGTFIENFFSQLIPFFHLNPNGTVAGSAVNLSSAITKNIVLLVGIDFSTEDIKTHCSPHSFDSLFLKKNKRLIPLPDYFYKRAVNDYPQVIEKKYRVSNQLSVYSDWFSNIWTGKKNIFYRLCPSVVEIKGVKNITFEEAEIFLKNKNDINTDKNENNSVFDSANLSVSEIKIKALELMNKLLKNVISSEEKDITADFFRSNIASGFAGDFLYYFDTKKYIELHKYSYSNSHNFPAKYKELTEECASFLKKEICKYE